MKDPSLKVVFILGSQEWKTQRGEIGTKRISQSFIPLNTLKFHC
jgi:hypothetical protein